VEISSFDHSKLRWLVPSYHSFRKEKESVRAQTLERQPQTELDEVVRRLAQAGATRDGPLSFQIVVKTSVRDKTPTGWGEIVALRVL
jgi:hypothetical protein